MVSIKGVKKCTLIIFLTSAFLNTASTKDILTSKCDGVTESRNGDFGLMDVANNMDPNCEFHMSTLASLRRDLLLFDTARMNCTGNGVVTFPTGRGQKNYCNQDKCLVFKRRRNKYTNEDILATVRDVFPTCMEYDIRRKPIPKRIIATPETKSFTLRYKVLEMVISTTHASQDTTASSITDHLSATDQQSELHTTANAIESATLLDTTVSAKDSYQKLRLHTTSAATTISLVPDTTASSKDLIGTPTSVQTKPTPTKETKIETSKIVLPEATTMDQQYPTTRQRQQTVIAGTFGDTALTEEWTSSKATHNYESTTEGITSNRNVDAGINHTSGISINGVAGLGVARNKNNQVQAWHIAVPIAILLLIAAVIVMILIFKSKDKKKDPEHTAEKSVPAQA